MIETLYGIRAITLPIHIGAGALVLILFWAQILSRKGSPLHVRAGKAYYWLGLVVVAMAGFGVTTIIARVFHRDELDLLGTSQFGAVMFLGYLTIVTWAVLERGRSAIRFRGPSPGKRAVFAYSRAFIAVSASAGLVFYALAYQPPNAILLYALSPLGFLIGIETISFQRRGNSSPNHWVAEHVDGMMGSGIAFHTAFFVFGAGQIFEPLLADSPIQILPWILPAVIGIPVTMLWKRRILKPQNETAS